MASEFRRRTLLGWSVIGAAGYGLKRSSRSPEDWERASAEDRGVKWHRHPINAFAISPDGQFVATGAQPLHESLSDATEGVVLWNVDEAAPVWRTPLAGGLMRVDAPFTALVFSPDGSKLAARTRRNEVTVIDVATGLVSGHHGLTAIEQSPRFFFSQSGEQLFVAATTLPGTIGRVVDARAALAGQPVRFESTDAVPFRLDERGVHVVAGSEYRIIGLDGTPTTVATFPAGLRTAVAVDVSRRHLAVTAMGRIATVDLESGQMLVGENSEATSVGLSLTGVPLGFAHRDEGWLAFQYSTGLVESALFTSQDVTVEPMADALPGALSPDGSHAIELLGTSEVTSWLAGRHPSWLGSLGRFPNARGVAWPRENRAVVFGPRLLAFVDPIARTTVADYGFPQR